MMFPVPEPLFHDVARLITSLLKERRRPKGGVATGIIIELAELSCIWTEVLQIINLM